MKKIYVLAGAVLLAACSSQESPTLIGGSRDNHGCLGSAGYTWSQTRQTCLRLWEEGITLIPTNPTGAALAAFAVESNDYARMEIFLPNPKKIFVLQQTGEDHDRWTSPVSDWTLHHSPAGWELKEKGVLRYKSKPAPTH